MNYLIWDWNGTLFNDVQVCIDTINEVLSSQDLPPLRSESAYRDVFTFPIYDYYVNLGFDFSRRSFRDLAGDFMDIYQSKSLGCSLTEGIEDILREVKKRGYAQIILSASKTDNLRQQLSGFTMENYFEEVLGIDDIYAASKVDIGKKWLKGRKDSLKPIMVGDTYHDYEVAHALGAECILYSRGHQNIKLSQKEDFFVIHEMKEILDFLPMIAE